MKQSLIILTFLLFISATAEPWDKLVGELTDSKTLNELKEAKSNFYSRHDRTPLTRSLDFGYEHTVWEFDFIHGNYSTDFKLSIISENDKIIFGKLERLHWRGRTEETYEFSVLETELQNLVNEHNTFYTTEYEVDEFLKELNQDFYFSLGCGETGSNRPKEADKMLKWAEKNNIKKLSKWLYSPNHELQAYAIDGLARIEESGKSIPDQQKMIIEHLRNRNSIVINCAGCLMGLETPVNKLLFEYRNR
jgi:hypothetical protein